MTHITGPGIRGFGARLLLIAASLGAVSCGGNSKLGGGEAGADASSAGVWNEHSQHIDVRCNSYHFGQQVLRGDRAQLTSEQLSLLAQLLPAPASSNCSSDNTTCNVSITDDAGMERNYRAAGDDALCGTTEPTIADAGLQALLDASSCNAGSVDTSPLTANALCLHGLFISDGAATRQKLLLREPGRVYHIELDQCPGLELAQQLSLQLFGMDPAVPIATGKTPTEPGPDQACLALDVTVTEPTTAEVVVAAQSGGGAALLQFR